MTLWAIGQACCPFQANGSLVKGPDGRVVGSRLIAQPFTRDEFFQPRPSAASFDASASASSSLAPSNYALRDRVARALGPLATYRDGRPVAPDVLRWFQEGHSIVAQWADQHPSLAQAWVAADARNAAYVDAWAGRDPAAVAQWIKDNPASGQPKAADLAVVFFKAFAAAHPGTFPGPVLRTGPDGKPQAGFGPVPDGADIPSVFFDMWRQDHPGAELRELPADLVTASGSGLDPHISWQNAVFQLDRVAAKWAADLHRDPAGLRREIQALLAAQAGAPLGGLAGEPCMNVLEVNLALVRRYGPPS